MKRYLQLTSDGVWCVRGVLPFDLQKIIHKNISVVSAVFPTPQYWCWFFFGFRDHKGERELPVRSEDPPRTPGSVVEGRAEWAAAYAVTDL